MNLHETFKKLEELSALVAGDVEMEEAVRVSQRLVGEAIKDEQQGLYGCHCDLEPGMKPDGCVLDEDREHDCIYAKVAKEKGGRHVCEYWRKMEVKWLSK